MFFNRRKHKSRRVVVITGASSGIGRAAAHAFARNNDRLALVARGEAGLAAAKRECEALDAEVLTIKCDVSDHHAVETAAQRVEAQMGLIDIWINNAAVSPHAYIDQTTEDEFKRVMEVNFLGTVYGTKAAMRRMLPRDNGMIINVGSALAYRGVPLLAAYCAAKHAVQGFCDTMWAELKIKKSKVRLTLIHPAGINTPLWNHSLNRMPMKPRPLDRIFQPEIVAQTIFWASDHDRREIFVGLPALKAVVGNKVVPWYADLVLARNDVEEQQSPWPDDPDRPNNLWNPVEHDPGVHGPYDDQAWSFSPQAWATRHRRGLATLGAGLVAGAAAGLVMRNQKD
jgi:NAD(P)-dependent dehydrogenase (short-subunit alcohol dehydrogenase family)